MRRWDGLEGVPSGWGRSVVAVGVFDGVHRGHQAILETAVGHGRELGLPVVVVTFDPHPEAVLRGTTPPVLTPLERRLALLGDHGAEAVCVLSFSKDLSSLTPEEFVQRVLVDRLHASAVVVGEDFRFGHRAAGDVAALAGLGAEYGFTADGVALVADGDTITSTRVRGLLAEGSVAEAAELLGRPHRVEGEVVHGAARGRELLGFPTANMDLLPDTAVPGDGVYAGWLNRTVPVTGEEARWPAAISVGTNPTFDGAERTVEAYALDRDDLDLYGLRMSVDFTVRIRGQERFESIDELIVAMHRDVDRCREVLGAG
ncbi:bifunctional riboflavin kinase/FMN adenylyltransferase [Nocardiopsis sp. TSRI0078]|uniref:bifunctional riboflavin kinase/FAD synthetase n=1 Tax=unclassified Nocardiopsis TaxID=2649073 RepID=UPI00093A4955|nr:bifunctional riboflavin kinase/FAD synthetase [Nocardiopsis sp. TSRI0078]OKI15249.1 bifunctional riboflavin kinase/FMN adenylyltransferase [Nocardiopsis sp. TSRI0078]